MARNELKTIFIFDEQTGSARIETVKNKLVELNTTANSLKTDKSVGEFQKLENAGLNSLTRINNAAKDIFTRPLDLPANTTNFDKLQSKVEEIRKSFSSIASQRLNTGNVTDLTKEITLAHDRARLLERDISSIKLELANPNKKSSIKFLTEELQAAENQAGVLNAKLSLLQNSSSFKSGGNLKLSSFQKQNLSYQVNDVLTGIVSGQPITQIAAQQSGQIAQIFSPAQASALVATYGSLVTVLGAGVAAIALTYKITGDIRAEAEKRLKVETAITAAMNNQSLAQNKALKDFKEQEQLAERARNFSNFLGESSINDLEIRKRNLTERLQFVPGALPGKDGKPEANPRFQILTDELNQINAQIDALKERKRILADDSFNRRNENFKNFQESTIEAEKRAAERIKNLKNLKTELNDAFVSAQSQENQFAKVLYDIDTAGERAEKRFGSLGKEVVKLAADFEKANLTKQFNELKFTTDLSALKYTQEARQIDQLPKNQRFEFTSNLEKVEKLVDFVASQSDVIRQSNYANYYADKFNPNNPIDADRYFRGNVNGNADFIYQTSNALDDIAKLKNISVENTGIYGQAAIARKILEEIPENTLSTLVEKLGSFGQEKFNAQNLLSERASALNTLRDFGEQKFNDSIALQNYNDLRRQDAYEQLGLLQNSTGLDRRFANDQILNITGELGVNNLDKGLLQARRDALINKSKDEKEKFDEAQKERAEAKQRNVKIDTFIENLTKLLDAKGLKVVMENGVALDINFKSNDKNATITGSAGTQEDVRSTYFEDAF